MNTARPSMLHPGESFLASVRRRLILGLVYCFLGFLALSVIYPMIWLLYTSLKTGQELFANPWALPEVPQWSNYVRAWNEAHIGRYFLNSVYVTTLSLLGSLVVCAMAGYVLARYEFRGRQVVFFGMISTMMIPGFLGLIPLWFLIRNMGLLGSYAGLIPVYVAGSIPFSIFFLTAFFKTISYELEEAGTIDGCTNYGVFFRIVLPLAKSGLLTIGIFNFLGFWNEFTTALVFITQDSRKTLPLGISTLLITSKYRIDWGALYAGLTIALIPTLAVYAVFQGRLTKGISIGALKG